MKEIIDVSKRKVGLFKDESFNNMIKEAIALRAKVYAYSYNHR